MMDPAERELLADALRKTMTTAASGVELAVELAELGWADILADPAGDLVGPVFELLGETGAHAPLLNDVVLAAAGRPPGGTVPLPYAGGTWVVWERSDDPGDTVDEPLPVRPVATGEPLPLAAGRRAVGWWLVGTGRAMLELARAHALDRQQFGRPIAGFQAVRHKLAETLVALEGAAAALAVTGGDDDDDLSALLGKAAAGTAALTAARHCQQVLGGIGFTAEHDLHRHVKRALFLDGLLGSTRELTREAGATLRERGTAPRLADL
jgi:hypothetical protein